MQQYSWRRGEQQQQEHIEEIHQLATRMKAAGRNIGQELHRQQGLIDTYHAEMQVTEGRLGDLQKQTQDINQVCTCMMLCCCMIVLLMLVIFI